MAVFFHGNRSITYQSTHAPFVHDLLLLQSSRLSTEFWEPVHEEFKDQLAAGGRIVTCEWFDRNLDTATMAEDLNNLIQTLGLHTLHVVACEDAVPVVEEWERRFPNAIAETLVYPQGLPLGEGLVRAVREFSKI